MEAFGTRSCFWTRLALNQFYRPGSRLWLGVNQLESSNVCYLSLSRHWKGARKIRLVAFAPQFFTFSLCCKQQQCTGCGQRTQLTHREKSQARVGGAAFWAPSASGPPGSGVGFPTKRLNQIFTRPETIQFTRAAKYGENKFRHRGETTAGERRAEEKINVFLHLAHVCERERRKRSAPPCVRPGHWFLASDWLR